MASIVFIKDMGIICLLLSTVGPWQIQGQSATDPSTTSSATMTSSSMTSATLMTTTNPTTDQSASMTAISSSAAPTHSTMSTGGTVMSTGVQPTTTPGLVSQSTHSELTTSGGKLSISTHSSSSTSGGSTSSSTHSPSTTSGGSALHSTHSSSSTSGGSTSSSTKSPPTTSRGWASHSTHSPSNTSGDMNVTNINSTSNSIMNMIHCPSFSCYYSECYSVYNNQNASECVAEESCQLLRAMGMWYNVSCSASCAETCTNTSQTNCSVTCCNSTGCLNDSFASMMMTTTVAVTTTTIAAPTTTANNGNKCHKGTCTGEACYTNFKTQTLETCSSTQPHCQLKKESSESGTVWTAGCTNCTGYAACSGATKPPCNLECCTTSKTSCLMLNGTLNVPSFATRGPYLHTELIASLVCLLAMTLLL